MIGLHARLTDSYADHYTRVNANGFSPEATRRRNQQYEFIFGRLVNGMPDGSRILDLGCGTGFLLHWLATKPRLLSAGVDASSSQIEHASGSLPANVPVCCDDGLNYLNRHVSTFSGIFCLDVLEHLIDLDTCHEWVAAAHGALRPGGFFLCRTPNAANLLGCYSRYMDLTHARSFTRTSMLQLLEAGGFERSQVLLPRARDFKSWARLKAEDWLHRVVYRIVSHHYEPAFCRDLLGLGYRGTNLQGTTVSMLGSSAR